MSEYCVHGAENGNLSTIWLKKGFFFSLSTFEQFQIFRLIYLYITHIYKYIVEAWVLFFAWFTLPWSTKTHTDTHIHVAKCQQIAENWTNGRTNRRPMNALPHPPHSVDIYTLYIYITSRRLDCECRQIFFFLLLFRGFIEYLSIRRFAFGTAFLWLSPINFTGHVNAQYRCLYVSVWLRAACIARHFRSNEVVSGEIKS